MALCRALCPPGLGVFGGGRGCKLGTDRLGGHVCYGLGCLQLSHSEVTQPNWNYLSEIPQQRGCPLEGVEKWPSCETWNGLGPRRLVAQ